jgi:hypothetical protein
MIELILCSEQHNLISRLFLIYTPRHVAVAQLLEALRYKPEGRGTDSRCCRWNFSLT